MPVTMNDFINLLKPGQLPELRQIIATALQKLTTASMLAVDPLQIKGIGTSITNVVSAGSSPTLVVAGSKYLKDIKRVVDQYNTIPSFLTAYTTPTDSALIAASKILGAATGTSGARISRLAIQDQPFTDLIDYINSSLQNFDSGLIYGLVKQNSAKTDTPTLDALTKVVQEYIKYLNSIVKIFNLDNGFLDKNYYRIIVSIETILTKLAIAVPSAKTISVTNMYNLLNIYAGAGPPVQPAPLQLPPRPVIPYPPSAVVYSNLTAGNGSWGDPNNLAFPNDGRITLQKNGGGSQGEGLVLSGPYIEGGTILSDTVQNFSGWSPNCPSCDCTNYALSKPVQEGGLNQVQLGPYTLSQLPPAAAVAKYDIEQAAATAKYNAANKPAQDAYKAQMAAYNTKLAAYNAVRQTPNETVVEVPTTIGNLISATTTVNLTALKSQKAVSAIQKLPDMIGSMMKYILSNTSFLSAAGGISQPVTSAIAAVYPVPSATLTLFTGINLSNFEANLTQPSTGIIAFINANWTTNLAKNILVPILNGVKNSYPVTELPVASSVLTKIFIYYTSYLNTLINIFKLNITTDQTTTKHITTFNDVFTGTTYMLFTSPAALGGRKTKRNTRKEQKRQKSAKRRRHRTKKL